MAKFITLTSHFTNAPMYVNMDCIEMFEEVKEWRASDPYEVKSHKFTMLHPNSGDNPYKVKETAAEIMELMKKQV